MPKFLLFLSLWIMSLTAFAQPALKIAVSIAPEKFFVERIAGEHTQVMVLLPAGANPHTYEPTPRQLAAVSDSRLYFAIGLPFEQIWLDRLHRQTQPMTIISLSQSDRAHDGAAGHAHTDDEDPHAWTDPRQVMTMADRIAISLQQLDPAHAQIYRHNADLFKMELTQLDRELHRQLDGLPRREFIVQHPAWGHFAAAYGLIQIPIERGGREPGSQQLAQLIDLARRKQLHTIFASPETDMRPARAVAQAIGGKVVILDPLREDYLRNLREVGTAIAQALRGS